MPGTTKLHLEDSLEDSPQTRSLLMVFEKDASLLKKYTTTLHNCCQRILSAQNELCAATQAMAQQLRIYELQKFPLEADDSILTSTLKQFASYLDDISSIHQVLAAQFSETMMFPLSKFLQADIEEISTMFEMFQIATNEHEQAVLKYMKLPKKKENEKVRRDVNEELYMTRKKFHQTALHYYASLNALQYKRKCFLLEPVLAYMHAQRAFFQMGQDAVGKNEIEEFMNNITASVQGVQQEMGQETQKTVELIDTLEGQSHHLYYPEPLIDMPYIPPNINLAQKTGYLYVRSKQSLIATKWERCYFFTQGGNLMSQSKEEFAGSLVIDLNEDGVLAESTDIDDRRFVFMISLRSNKRVVILQAENERERDEWIATINNIVREGGYVKGKAVMQPPQRKSKDHTGSTGSAKVKSDSMTLSASVEDMRENSITALSTPCSSSSTDNFLPDTPIQFDLISPSDDQICTSPASLKDGQMKRINPFDQSPMNIINDGNGTEYSQTFIVRFLGSMEVKNDRGEVLVHNTMRQIMAARAIHNVFKMTESNLIVSSSAVRLVDPATKSIRTSFALQDISFWAGHNENDRLFGFITRSKVGGSATYACHVFECNTPAAEICHSISTVTKMAFEALMGQKIEKKRNQEKNLLLANIQQLDDKSEVDDIVEETCSPPLSPDGKYLILSSFDQSEVGSLSPDLNSPNIQQRQDDVHNERKVEGAECESEA